MKYCIEVMRYRADLNFIKGWHGPSLKKQTCKENKCRHERAQDSWDSLLYGATTAKVDSCNVTHICPSLHQDALWSSKRHKRAEREQTREWMVEMGYLSAGTPRFLKWVNGATEGKGRR